MSKFSYICSSSDIIFRDVCYMVLFTSLMVSHFVYFWVALRLGDELTWLNISLSQFLIDSYPKIFTALKKMMFFAVEI